LIRSNLFEWLVWGKLPSHQKSSAVRANCLCTCIYSGRVWPLRHAGRRVSQQNAAPYTNGRNDGQHNSNLRGGERLQWAVSRFVAVSCSEIRGPRSVFLANQVLDPRILVKVVPRRGVRCLTKDLGASAIIAITVC
jgi:hypothetical protein